MKHIRLIEIKKLELALYSLSHEKEIVKNLPELEYSTFRDLRYDSQSAGIAFRISFINEQSLLSRPRGIRRTVQMVITEAISNKEIVVKDLNLMISKNDYNYIFHSYIPMNYFPLEEHHDYKINFYDWCKGDCLGEYQFCINKVKNEIHLEENDTFDDLLNDWIKSNIKQKEIQIPSSYEKTNFNIAMNKLTGLKEVKKKLINYDSLVLFNKKRKESGLPTLNTPLHAMFLGSPGTGKTTVAKMMGEMLHERGLLSKGHVIVKERANLLGQNYNSEGENTLESIEAAQGGILFIDEAYQLFQPQDPRDPGKFVIETLLTALSDPLKNDWMVILAGYPEEMKNMWLMNPGFKSRIPESNIYYFEDFTEEELIQIAENYFFDNKYHLTTEAHKVLTDRVKFDLLNKDETFGNARYIINLIQTEIIPSMAVRLIREGKCSYEALCHIKPEDIPEGTWTNHHRIRNRIGYVA